jgi:hypothetical protein
MSADFPSRETVERLRKNYPHGAKIELVQMNDPYTTLKPGDCGTIDFVDDAGGVHINWDNGSTLAAVYGEDVIRKL